MLVSHAQESHKGESGSALAFSAASQKGLDRGKDLPKWGSIEKFGKIETGGIC